MNESSRFSGQGVGNEAQMKVALYKTRQLCQQMGFGDIVTSKITTAASELLRNVLKYAGTGHICLRECGDADKTGIEILVCDNGPGIDDIELALQEQYSTSGTLGMGLPGVKRLMDEFFVDSNPGNTKVTIRKFL